MANRPDTSTNGNGRRTLTEKLVNPNAGDGGRAAIPGLTPFLPGHELAVFEHELRQLSRCALDAILGPGGGSGAEALLASEVENNRAILINQLGIEYNALLPGLHVSLERVRATYIDVMAQLCDEYSNRITEPDCPIPMKLPPEIVALIKSGQIWATEDFQAYINRDSKGFVQAVFKVDAATLKSEYTVNQFVKLAIGQFQKIFVKANVKLLDALGMRQRYPADPKKKMAIFPEIGAQASVESVEETDDQMSDRIDRHQREAVLFIEEIHKAALAYQSRAVKAWQKCDPSLRGPCPAILTATMPRELTFKRFSDLAELVFYPNQYAIGAQRRFVGQQIMFLTLMYDYVHRFPAFNMAAEAARQLHDELNFSLEGRDAKVVEGIFMDVQGNKSLDQNDQYCAPYDGINSLRLKPKLIPQREGHGKVLFPQGQSIIIDSRCKSAASTVLKLLNKGEITKVTDLVGVDFIIDDRNMDQETLRQTILDLKEYIKQLWGVTEFAEDYTGITSPESVVVDNVSSSTKFVTEKVILYRLVNKVRVPVEVQFKTLRMKLDAERKEGEASHVAYKVRQAVNLRAFEDLFPTTIFGGFASIAAKVERGVQQQLVQDERVEATV